MSPYTAVFGDSSGIGLDQINLPKDSVEKIKTARQLYLLLGN